MTEGPRARVVAEPFDLAELAASAAGRPAVYLDTEFVRTRTYFAQPGLVQVGEAGNEEIALVDPIALEDLSALAPLLAGGRTIKVLHSGAEDLALLHQVSGAIPRPVFDTQIAAAYCGLGASPGYHALVREMLGIELAKGETRSDWTRRPLSEGQLRYAAEDVAHLPALHAALAGLLAERGMSGWAEEDFEALSAPERFEAIPPDAYRRAKGAAHLAPRDLEVFRRLWKWREGVAMALDRPRGRVVPDEIVVAIATRRPSSRAALAALDGIAGGFVRRHGDEVLAIVGEAQAADPGALPLPLGPGSERRGIVDRLRELVRGRAEALDIPPELLASRRQIEALVVEAGAGRALALGGWRREALGGELDALLELAR
jgi:ribonuclease D